MAYIFANPNPEKQLVGDCVIRGISLATGKSWEDVFLELMIQAFTEKDMPSSNYVWAAYLYHLGFDKTSIPDMCPNCYTIKEFCNDHPQGTFILGTGSHVVCVKDGDYLDTWDSGNEIPIYYWKKEE